MMGEETIIEKAGYIEKYHGISDGRHDIDGNHGFIDLIGSTKKFNMGTDYI